MRRHGRPRLVLLRAAAALADPFNLFQALAINRFTGQLDFGPMDAVFAAAEAHDQMIPVLAPQDGACEDALVQYHDYGADGVPLPGDQWNGLGRRLEQAAALGKPLLVREIGELAGSCATLTDRASHIAAKIQGQRDAGAAGALLWAFARDPRPPSAPTTAAPTTRFGTWWSSSEAGVRAPPGDT